MTLLEDLPHFSLWHDASSAGLYATWRGSHAGRLTRVQYNLIRWHLQATRSTKLLNDSLLDEGGWQEIVGWLADSYFHVLAREGLEAVAWVLPQHLSALCDTSQVIARLKHLQQPLINTFDDVQAACNWLQHWPASARPAPQMQGAFLALPQAQQVALAEQHGHPLASWWEADFSVQAYLLGDTLRVEVAYYVHSGLLYRVRAYSIPQW